jgi:hypothetical protein
MRRFLFLPAAALLSALTFGCGDHPTTPDALAEPGGIAARGGRPIDVTFTEDLPAGAFCDFAVRIEGTEKEKTIELPNDRTLLIFPGARYTFTNLSNGNQETFPVPGSILVTTRESGDVEIVARGRNLIGQPFEPRFLVLAIGRFSQVFDSQGNLVQPLQGSGQLIDLCALLG